MYVCMYVSIYMYVCMYVCMYVRCMYVYTMSCRPLMYVSSVARGGGRGAAAPGAAQAQKFRGGRAWFLRARQA